MVEHASRMPEKRVSVMNIHLGYGISQSMLLSYSSRRNYLCFALAIEPNASEIYMTVMQMVLLIFYMDV